MKRSGTKRQLVCSERKGEGRGEERERKRIKNNSLSDIILFGLLCEEERCKKTMGTQIQIQIKKLIL